MNCLAANFCALKIDRLICTLLSIEMNGQDLTWLIISKPHYEIQK